MSLISKLHNNIYDKICGKHPYQYPWHFQWLATSYLHGDMKNILGSLGGRVLDVGCSSKPYQSWFGKVENYIGLDIFSAPEIDLVVDKEAVHWPIESNEFDTILCTQVAEHVRNVEVIREIYRVTKPGGKLVISVPFIYNEHGSPDDYRRFTINGIKELLLSMGWIIDSIKREGAIGSNVGLLFLNWLDTQLNLNKTTRIIKGLLLPVFIGISFIVNMLAILWDKLDTTGNFYNNLILTAKKPCE